MKKQILIAASIFAVFATTSCSKKTTDPTPVTTTSKYTSTTISTNIGGTDVSVVDGSNNWGYDNISGYASMISEYSVYYGGQLRNKSTSESFKLSYNNIQSDTDDSLRFANYFKAGSFDLHSSTLSSSIETDFYTFVYTKNGVEYSPKTTDKVALTITSVDKVSKLTYESILWANIPSTINGVRIKATIPTCKLYDDNNNSIDLKNTTINIILTPNQDGNY